MFCMDSVTLRLVVDELQYMRINKHNILDNNIQRNIGPDKFDVLARDSDTDGIDVTNQYRATIRTMIGPVIRLKITTKRYDIACTSTV